MRRRSPDFWSGLALAALGGYIVFEARGWSYSGPDGPGPGFFPLWYGIAMLVLSFLLVFSKKEHQRIEWQGAARAFAVWAAFAVSVALLKLVGNAAFNTLGALVEYASRHARSPWFAIGGIDAATAPAVIAAGASRLAVLRAITDAPDPERAARELRSLLA